MIDLPSATNKDKIATMSLAKMWAKFLELKIQNGGHNGVSR